MNLDLGLFKVLGSKDRIGIWKPILLWKGSGQLHTRWKLGTISILDLHIYKLKILEAQLYAIQAQSLGYMNLQRKIKEELKTHRYWLEIIYKQKSREVWLATVDRNTRFFHASLVAPRRRNKNLVIKRGLFH